MEGNKMIEIDKGTTLLIHSFPQKAPGEIDEEKLATARSYVRGTGLQITPVRRQCSMYFLLNSTQRYIFYAK